MSKTDEIKNGDVLSPIGLYLYGVILDRSRRNVGEKMIEVVTYRVKTDNEQIYYVKHWTPSEYFTVGESVAMPVYGKAYLQNGQARFELCVRDKIVFTKGERF